LLFTWVAIVLAFDQASKVYAIQHWRPTALEPLAYLGGIFRIQYAENPGAFLSLFGGLDVQIRFWVLTVVNGVILAGVGACLLVGRPGDRWTWTALALILGGGIGNLIDRIRFDNHVIDFLILSTGDWQVPVFGEIRTGIFNVADMAITAGFLMLLPGVIWPPAASGSAAQGTRSRCSA
jgi:signal peptidase II